MKTAPLYLIHIASTPLIRVMSHVMQDNFMYILNTGNTRIPQTKQCSILMVQTYTMHLHIIYLPVHTHLKTKPSFYTSSVQWCMQ